MAEQKKNGQIGIHKRMKGLKAHKWAVIEILSCVYIIYLCSFGSGQTYKRIEVLCNKLHNKKSHHGHLPATLYLVKVFLVVEVLINIPKTTQQSSVHTPEILDGQPRLFFRPGQHTREGSLIVVGKEWVVEVVAVVGAHECGVVTDRRQGVHHVSDFLH